MRSGSHGEQLHTLHGAEHPYRVMVETMQQGAVTLTGDGTIVYANRSFAAMLDMPLEDVIGSTMSRFVLVEDLPYYETLVQHAQDGSSKGEVRLGARGGSVVPVYLSISSFESSAPGSLCAVVTDLTEHKRNEELIAAQALERAKRAEAEAARQRITDILESITDSFFALDREWRIIDFNQRAASFRGSLREETIGQVFWDIVPQARNPEIAQHYERAMTDRIPVHFELGSGILVGRWFEVHVYPTDEGVAVYFSEITERKQAEERLRRSEAHLAEAQRIGQVGSWTWNISTGELFWSLEHFRVFGLDPETFRPNLENTQRLIHPEDMPLVTQILERAIRERSSFEVDYRIVRPDGSIRHHRGLGRPTVTESDELQFIGTAADVTDRKQADEELRRSEACLAEAQRLSHTGSWAWNISTGDVFWSPETFRIFGFEPGSVKPSYPLVLQWTHADDRSALQHAFDNAIRERSDFDIEVRIVRPDRTIRHVHRLAHPVFNESGDLTEYVGTIIDITERKEEEEARKELLRRISVAQEDERRRISREMHDQLGQQLSALTLKLSALKREHSRHTDLGEQLASLEMIARQLDADVDFIVWQLRPTALDDLGLAAALTDYVNTWSAHFGVGAELHLRGIEAGRLTDEIETAIYRILQEALNNIAKHAAARHVDILLEGRSDHVSLIVEDDGAGIDEKTVGSGDRRLGVIGMRERAALVGGTLDIESHHGHGTTVIARIPAPGDPARSPAR